MPSDLEVSAIRMKVAFISSMETHMLSNIFPDRSLFNDLKYPTYNQLCRFWWRLFECVSSCYNHVHHVSWEIQNEVQIKISLQYWRLSLLRKRFLSLFYKGPIKRKCHKNEDQWLSTEEVFHQCRLSFQTKENLIRRKKGGSRSFQLHFTYTDGVFVTRSNCQLLFLWHQS